MRSLGKLFGLVAALFGGYFVLSHYEIQGLDRLNLKPRGGASALPTTVGGPPPVSGAAETITIRLLQYTSLSAGGQARQTRGDADPGAPGRAAVRRDRPAGDPLEENQDLIPKFLAPHQCGRGAIRLRDQPSAGSHGEQGAVHVFLYDYRADPNWTARACMSWTIRTICSTASLWWPASGSAARPPQEAFTFTLVDIHTDPDEVAAELDAAWTTSFPGRARRDGRGEDDVILLGDLNADDHHLGQLGTISNIAWAISGVASNTRGNKLYDNILFTSNATTEYTGRSGVLNLMQEFHLTLEQALEVSDHMPVWAEFTSAPRRGRGRSEWPRVPAGAPR